MNSNVDITIVLKGDISLSSFRLVSRNPGEVIEAENYDDMHGSFMTEATKDSAGGTENIGGVTAGEWAKYSDVNFAYGVKSITVRHASQAASRMEVRLDSVDGPLIVSMDESATGSWNDYTTATVNVNTVDGKKVTGLHDIYVIFRSIMNLNWFKFTACDPVDPTDMKLVKDAETIEEGQTCWIDAEFEPYDASERVLEYSSDDENVAVVSEFGEVTGKAPGKTTIQVTSKAVPSLKAVFTVTVTKKPEPVQENKPETTPGTTVNTDVTGKTVTDTVQAAKLDTKVKGYLGRKITLKKGKKLSISATLSPEGSGKVLYSSSNSKVATVSDTGVVKAKKTGTVKITVQNESGSVKTVYTVKVVSKEKVNKKLKLKKTVLAMKQGDTGQIAYKKITGGTTSRFSFTSSKKNVASVDAYGVIRANAKGNAVIKVKCGKKTAKIKVKVS